MSTDTTPAKGTGEQQATPAAASEDAPKSSKKRSKKKGVAKAEPTPEATPTVSTVVDEPEMDVEGSEVREEEEGEGKRRKKKGEKVSVRQITYCMMPPIGNLSLSLSLSLSLFPQGKREKKGGKKSKRGAAEVADSIPTEPAATGGGDLFDLDLGSQQPKQAESKFQVLAEDSNLKMVWQH